MTDYNITAVTRRKVFSGSAGVGPYAFTFPILTQTDIVVYKNSTKLTLTTDYTVTINGTNGTGSVTLVVAATSSDTITIIGARAIQRTTDFVTAGDLAASSLNEQLDGLTIMVQQLAEENKRTIKAPPYDPEAVDDGGILNMQLPAKADRAGKVMAFDSDGNPSAGASSLPSSLTATYYPRVNAAGTAYELRSPATVRSDIGADDASNLTSGTVANARLPGTIDGKTLTNVTISSGTITGITDLAVADGGTGASNASGARTNLGLAIGTDVQAYDPQLADIAGLTPSDNNFIVGNGTNFVTESGSTARTSLGLGSIATQDSNNVTITGGSISGVTFAYTTPLTIPGTSSATGEIRLAEDTDNGTNYVGLKAPAAITSNLSWTLPAADGLSGQFLSTDGSGTLSWVTPAGAGDVVGPASATDNALARFDGTSGKAIQNSGATLSDTGVLTVTELSTDTVSEKTAAAGVTVDGVLLKDSAVNTDTINEKTSAAGVTIDGVLLKDAAVNTDTINEKTAAAGVTVDGVLLKDAAVNTDIINEKTSAAGVTIDGVVLKDGGATLTSPIILADGTASAPAITNTGDTNTGIYFSGDNAIGFTTDGSQRGEFDASGNFKFNSGYGSAAVAYGCRAWVNFNGTGTVAIRSSANVTSITDNAVGDYTVNFTTALVDANYSSVVSLCAAYGLRYTLGAQINTLVASAAEQAPTTTAFRFSCIETSAAAFDPKYASVAIFR